MDHAADECEVLLADTEPIDPVDSVLAEPQADIEDVPSPAVEDGEAVRPTIEENIERADETSAGPSVPLLRLVFKDSQTFAELRSIISTCIRDTLFARKQPIEVAVRDDEYTVYFNELDNADGQNDSIFMIDTLPAEHENATNEVPVYELTNENAMLNNDRPSNGSDEDGNGRPKHTCWNCGGDHMLRECTQPKDSSQINRSKSAFNRGKTERYHVDGDKYGQFAPGVISNDLREALGVRKRELPSFIYRMRLYGYPPGWLEDAKVSSSGLSLFISETKQITDPNAEDGEVEARITYDPSRFINYPGFNAELPRDIRDDSHYHNVPPMQPQQSKEAMIYGLQDNLVKTYKRKKLKHVIDGEKAAGDDSVDMEIANSEEDDAESPESPPPGVDNPTAVSTPGLDAPLSPAPGVDTPLSPACEVTDTPTITKTSLSSISLHDAVTQNSPSMIELQRQKAALLQALAESNDTTIDESLLDDMLDKTVDTSTVAVAGSNVSTPRASTASASRLSLASSDGGGTPVGTTKVVVSGTPLLKTASPYAKLPEGASWSAGVSDVIDFENLPDSTGTYDKLSGLIRKVRTVVSKINEANDAEDDDD